MRFVSAASRREVARNSASLTRMAGTGTGGSRVLVVDDDQMIRDIVQVGLEAAGHEVVLAEDGVDALGPAGPNAL